MAVLFGDTFVDTNGVVLPSHTPTGASAGLSWSRGPNSTADLAIQANGVVNLSTAFLDVHAVFNQSGSWPADVSVAFDAHFLTNANEFPAVTVRHASGSDICYGAQWGGTAGGWSLVLSNAAGNFVTNLSTTAYAYPGNGVTDHMVLEVQGNQLRLYKNGTLFVSATDNTIAAAGKPGIYNTSGVAGTATTMLHFENLVISDLPAASAGHVGASRLGPQIGPRDRRGFLPQMKWAYPLLVAGAIAVNPDVGQLALTGFAPTVAVSNNQQVAANVGALTLTGFAPTVATPVAVLSGAGSLTLTGFAPSVVVNSVVNPGAGQFTLTGFAPTVATPVSVLPGKGDLTLIGFAPSVAIGTNVNPGTGQLTLTGFAPTVATPVAVLPGVGALSLTGFAPSVVVGVNVRPNVGSLTLAGFAPTVVSTNNQSVAAGLGQLTLTGFAPTVFASSSQSVAPGAGLLSLSGFPPTVTVTGGAIPRAIAQNAATDTLTAGSSASSTVAGVNSSTVPIGPTNSQTISLLSANNGVASIESSD